MRRCSLLLVLVAASAGVACASSPAAPTPTAGLTVVADDAPAFAGPAAFTVRVEGAGVRDVVSLPHVGEILVDDDRCSFVAAGAGAVTVWRADGRCAEVRGDRLCFADARFVDDAGALRVRVAGCADRNEVFLKDIDVDGANGLGPRTRIERCAEIAARDPRYLRVDDIFVDDNREPWRGLRFRHDGDAFSVCFLSGARGRYRVEVFVEDPLPRVVVVEGAVDER